MNAKRGTNIDFNRHAIGEIREFPPKRTRMAHIGTETNRQVIFIPQIGMFRGCYSGGGGHDLSVRHMGVYCPLIVRGQLFGAAPVVDGIAFVAAAGQRAIWGRLGSGQSRWKNLPRGWSTRS